MSNKIKDNTLLIDDLDTLKVIADPLRSQILELLIQEPQTVKLLAEKLGLAPSKLYYHVNLLEKHGLIQIAETRIVANMIEKLYRATATSLKVDPDLLRFTTLEGQDSINAILTSTIDATREDLVRSMEVRAFELEQGEKNQPRTATITRILSRVSTEQVDQFQARLNELVEEFDEADNFEAGDGLQTYALTVAFYPSFYYKKSDDQNG